MEGNCLYEYGFYEMEREEAKMLGADLVEKVTAYNMAKEMVEALEWLNIGL